MLEPLWRCAALSGCDIASVLMRCWNGMSLRGVSRVSAPQLVCSGLYSAGDSLFPFFFLGVTTMRVALVFFFFFFCVYYYLHIACFNALSFPSFLEFLFLLMCSTVPVPSFFFKNKNLD